MTHGNKGIKLTRKQRKRISKSVKKQHILHRKIKKPYGFQKGDKNPMKNKVIVNKVRQKLLGRKLTLKYRNSIVFKKRNKKISLSLTGKKLSISHRKKLSKSHKGYKHTDSQKKKITLSLIKNALANKNFGMRGKKHTEKYKQNRSKNYSGSGHPNWLGGKSFEPYNSNFNKRLKHRIMKLYNFICPISNIKSKSLCVHHINYNKLDCRDINLIPLVRSVHARTNFNRDYWFAYFCYIKNIESEVLLDW